ncbi:N-acetylmuramoyl-L-alanine amidase [Peptoniphilus sp. GNH]|nr:N-acetylmuramoyl-L-alanine amidase [Clostridiales bacterium KA00134]UHR02528.1 N-acetylmuramoyl-L-alanine amidase [Peptoniphilus sp. GNH]
MKIQKLLVKCNYSSRQGSPISYIVIHDTANVNRTATAYNHFRFFSSKRGASAHYFVDENGIIQIIEDANSAWHVGDGRGRFGILNRNSIGVEMCVNKGADFSKTFETTLRLTSYLMDKHKIDLDHVVRHFDASRKMCPFSLSYDKWEGWRLFKTKLKALRA